MEFEFVMSLMESQADRVGWYLSLASKATTVTVGDARGRLSNGEPAGKCDSRGKHGGADWMERRGLAGSEQAIPTAMAMIPNNGSRRPSNAAPFSQKHIDDLTIIAASAFDRAATRMAPACARPVTNADPAQDSLSWPTPTAHPPPPPPLKEVRTQRFNRDPISLA